MADLENRNTIATTGTTPAPQQSSNSTAIQDTQIARLITDLMVHYWMPDISPATRTAAIKDWIVDLREFPSSFVAAACREWRQSNTRRPTPADIRLLAIAAQRAFQPGKPPMKAITDQDREAMPGPDVVRSDWWHRAYRSLTLAERELFRARARATVAALPDGAVKDRMASLAEAMLDLPSD